MSEPVAWAIRLPDGWRLYSLGKDRPVLDHTISGPHLDLIPLYRCPRCNRREPRLDYCAGCDREMCQTCHRDHKECAE